MLESLLATGILLLIVVAVTNAITAGQQHALVAQQRIGGSLAAEELMGRLLTVAYADLPTWHGFSEPVGAMTDMDAVPYPDALAGVGRSVSVTTLLDTLPETGIRVRGREVRVLVISPELEERLPLPPAPEGVAPTAGSG